jgi:hypothetical protein
MTLSAPTISTCGPGPAQRPARNATHSDCPWSIAPRMTAATSVSMTPAPTPTYRRPRPLTGQQPMASLDTMPPMQNTNKLATGRNPARQQSGQHSVRFRAFAAPRQLPLRDCGQAGDGALLDQGEVAVSRLRACAGPPRAARPPARCSSAPPPRHGAGWPVTAPTRRPSRPVATARR